MSIPVRPIAPWQLNNGEPGNSPDEYGWHLLAEGDSWFSYGSFLGNNLIDQLRLSRGTLVTKTATPGDTLDHMVDWWRDSNFPSLIHGGSHGNRAWKFDAILLSGGGNDLIDAVGGRHADQRILRQTRAAAPPPTVLDCIHEPAWDLFEAYLRANFRAVSDFVAGSPLNAATPIFAHTYDFPTARDAGAGLGNGPWLIKALRAHAIPPPLWTPLVDELFTRLAGVIRTLNLPNVHVVDTAGTLVRALPGETGNSHDWRNEIHPNARGYRKLAHLWRQVIESRLPP